MNSLKCLQILVAVILFAAAGGASPVSGKVKNNEKDGGDEEIGNERAKRQMQKSGNSVGGQPEVKIFGGQGQSTTAARITAQLPFSEAALQYARYPNYAGLMLGGYPGLTASNLQAYPAGLNGAFNGAFNGAQYAASGASGVYPNAGALPYPSNIGGVGGNGLYPSYAYGNNYYPNAQLPTYQNPNIASTLDSLVNYANLQGIQPPANGLQYQQQAQAQLGAYPVIPGYFGQIPYGRTF